MENTLSAGTVSVTEEAIGAAVGQLVCEWAFPGDTCHTPDALTMAQAHILTKLLCERMRALVAEGINPLSQSISELLPGVKPHELAVYDPNFED